MNDPKLLTTANRYNRHPSVHIHMSNRPSVHHLSGHCHLSIIHLSIIGLSIWPSSHLFNIHLSIIHLFIHPCVYHLSVCPSSTCPSSMCPTNHLLLLAVGSLKGRHPDSQLTITPGASSEPPVHPTCKSVDCRRSQREHTNTHRKWSFTYKQGIRTWNLFAVGVPVILFQLFKSQVVCWALVAMVTVNVGRMPHCVCWLNPHSWSRPLRFWCEEWKRSWIPPSPLSTGCQNCCSSTWWPTD